MDPLIKAWAGGGGQQTGALREKTTRQPVPKMAAAQLREPR